MKATLLRLFTASAMVFLTVPSASPAAIKSMDDIKLLAAEGNYSAAAGELDKVLKLNPTCPVAQTFDMYEVSMLDAECNLHTGSRGLALKATETAMHAADDIDDQDKFARATLLHVMIDKSKNNKYTPRTGGNRTPVDILNSAAREASYPLVLNDEIDAIKQRQFKTKATVKLDPLMDEARHFAGVRAIEHLVTGNTLETEKLGLQASKDVDRLVTNWIKDRAHDLDRIAKDAARPVQTTQQTVHGLRTVTHPAGLGQNAALVNQYVSDCEQLPDAMAVINKGFGGSLELDGIYRDSDTLKQRAQDLISKYSN